MPPEMAPGAERRRWPLRERYSRPVAGGLFHLVIVRALRSRGSLYFFLASFASGTNAVLLIFFLLGGLIDLGTYNYRHALARFGTEDRLAGRAGHFRRGFTMFEAQVHVSSIR
ncbi:hypothetical protein V8C34DRAFT_250511 [Trichoderma compactum]